MPRVITNPEDEEIITLPTIAESWRVPTEAIEQSVEEAIDQLGPFVGTDGTAPGQAGLVPAPATTDADKYLKSDGTWGEGGASAVLYDGTGQNTDGAMTQKATTDALGGKQNTLTAGTNISISSDVISATDTTYSAGSGLSLDGTEFSVDTTAIQPKLTAGTNITIDSNNEISATDTTYSDFTGTDGTTAGTAGLVPAPATADADKFLKADGTWAEAGGGGGSGIPTDAKFWGQSYDNANNKVSGNIDLGGGTKSIINDSSISNSGALFLANGAVAIAIKTTTLNSAQYRFEELAAYFSKPLFMAQRNTTVYRPIKNMADPTDPHDAATKNYVDSIYPVGAVFTSTSSTAPTIAGGTWTEIGTQTVGSSTVHYYERTA
jgi:hypothetical protein